MVQYQFLIFFLVTVTFAISEGRIGRRNYNVNTNVNQNIVSGLHSHNSREDIRDEYVSRRPEPFLDEQTLNEMQDRDESYGVPAYAVRGPESGDALQMNPVFNAPKWDYPPSENFDIENSKSEYYTESIRNDDNYGGEVCDDGTYHPAIRDRLSYPRNIEQETRPYSKSQAYRRGWEGPPPIEPKFRRNNWGHLGQPNVYSPHGIKGPLASNMNSNANYMGLPRRHNTNANVNTNIIGHEGYGSLRQTQGAFPESTLYPIYVPHNYAPSGPVAPIKRPSSVLRPKPGFPDQWQRPIAENKYENGYHPSGNPVDDKYDNNGGYMEWRDSHGHENANINTNSNVNIIGRRMKPRSRRNVEHQPEKNPITPQLSRDVTESVAEESSTSGRP